MVQTLKILTDAYTSRTVRGQSTLKDVIEWYFWNGLSRERQKAMKALYALYAKYAKYAKYANVPVEKRTLAEKSKISNLKPNCIYSMQSIKQYYFRVTEEQNSNGCKQLVKKDPMQDSLDAKERSYDNSTNGINFTIRKVNLMFVFIVVVQIFFFNKCMIQNPVFFVYNAIMLSSVYAIVLWANFYVKLLMSSSKAAVNSFDECNVFEKAAQLSVIVYDKLNDSNDEAISINAICNCRS